tara:strand:+ start:333 stop:518 length:186 start_codon:yes stop_codon:yes gene_type:complete
MQRLRKVTKKIFNDEYNSEVVKYLYECDRCSYERWSYSKRLYQFCPRCRKNDKLIRMSLAI